MESLFNAKINWRVYFLIIALILLLSGGMSLFSAIAIIISLHQFLLLFYALGYVIPIRYLFGAFMCLQMLVGPMLAYNGLDQFQRGQYKMQIPEAEYFLYVIPAVICFIIGLHLTSKKLKGEFLNEESIRKYI